MMFDQSSNKPKHIRDWISRLDSPVPDVWPEVCRRVESMPQSASVSVEQKREDIAIESRFAQARPRKTGWRRPAWVTAVSLVLVLAIVLVVLFLKGGDSTSIRAIEQPTYPITAGFTNPAAMSRLKDYVVEMSYLEALTDFTIRSAAEIVSKDGSQNSLYSPLSLWFALAMSADSASGNTRQEILQALSLNKFQSEWIDEQSSLLFKRLYFENEIGRLKIMNSLWLDNQVTFKQDYLKKAAKTYFTESNQIDFSNASANQKINDWINQQSDGRLAALSAKKTAEYVRSDQTSPQSLFALINTLSFADQWIDRFDEKETKPDVFHLPNGRTVTTPFMNRTHQKYAFIAAEGYTAAGLSFKNQSSMMFVLPNEGQTPQSILANTAWMKQIISLKNQQMGEVIFKIPKFDLKSEAQNIPESLETIGIKDAFNPGKADFSALSDVKPLWISRVEQSVRVKIDEFGCTADAVTKILYTASARQGERCEMILDRPFIFIIFGPYQVPLFIGVVNNPAS